MKYRIIKKNGWWRAFIWNEKRKGWDWIPNSLAITKFGCKWIVKKYHKLFKSNVGIKSEEFELE